MCFSCFGNNSKDSFQFKNEDVDISPTSKQRKSRVEMHLKKKGDTITDAKPKRLYELKDKFRCIFCGGKNCKHENFKNHKNPAIYGLNSDQITENLFASQRPSNVLIRKYNLVHAFKSNGIGLIINLQRQGEHPYCGPNGLDELSGFSYTPSLFSSEGIRVRLSGWKDMDVPDSLHFMLEIVKDMYSTIFDEGKKVLVHCHAGYGRTGIVIACYLIFITNKTADEAVEELRKRREKCIEKDSQMQYCIRFKEYIDRIREVFTQEKAEIVWFLKNQIDFSCGQDANKYLYIPRVMVTVFEVFIDLKTRLNLDLISIYQALNGTLEITNEANSKISAIINEINQGNWESLKECEDIKILGEVLYIWMDECVKACILPSNIKNLFENEQMQTLYKNTINTPEISTKDTRVALYTFISTCLRKFEFEIIQCVSNFILKMTPEKWTDQLKIDFMLMIEKLAIALLGYNIEMLQNDNEKDKDDPNRRAQLGIVDNFILLLKFMGVTLRSDEELLYKNDVNSPRKSSLSFLRKPIMEENNSVAQGSELNIRGNLLGKFTNMQTRFSLMSNSDGGEMHDKDKFLWGMYNALQQYFGKPRTVQAVKSDMNEDIVTPMAERASNAYLVNEMLEMLSLIPSPEIQGKMRTGMMITPQGQIPEESNEGLSIIPEKGKLSSFSSYMSKKSDSSKSLSNERKEKQYKKIIEPKIVKGYDKISKDNVNYPVKTKRKLSCFIRQSEKLSPFGEIRALPKRSTNTNTVKIKVGEPDAVPLKVMRMANRKRTTEGIHYAFQTNKLADVMVSNLDDKTIPVRNLIQDLQKIAPPDANETSKTSPINFDQKNEFGSNILIIPMKGTKLALKDHYLSSEISKLQMSLQNEV